MYHTGVCYTCRSRGALLQLVEGAHKQDCTEANSIMTSPGLPSALTVAAVLCIGDCMCVCTGSGINRNIHGFGAQRSQAAAHASTHLSTSHTSCTASRISHTSHISNLTPNRAGAVPAALVSCAEARPSPSEARPSPSTHALRLQSEALAA